MVRERTALSLLDGTVSNKIFFLNYLWKVHRRFVWFIWVWEILLWKRELGCLSGCCRKGYYCRHRFRR